jgi:hypothetical protein
MRFLIEHVFDFHSNCATPGATDASPDMVNAILEEGAKFCENVLVPLNRSDDEEGCHFANGVVTTSSKPSHNMLKVAGMAWRRIRFTVAKVCLSRWAW